MAASRGGTNASLTLDGPPEQVVGRSVTVNFFSVLGITPALGRAFNAGDDQKAGIVGRTIVMNDARREVVGVTPRSFVFRNREVDYWMPMRLPPQLANTRNSQLLEVH